MKKVNETKLLLFFGGEGLATMFANLRRVRKCQLLTTILLLCTVMLCWEELDHHVLSHIRSYMYRYLVDRYNFDTLPKPNIRYPSYLINHPWKCGSDSGNGRNSGAHLDVFLLLFVKSSPENRKQRQVIRETWGNESFIQSELGVRVIVLFALGVHHDAQEQANVQAALLQEDQEHQDLIQQDFLDTFHNLTQKLLLQFHWAHEHCRWACFFMSADDDVFVHIPNLVGYLRHFQRMPSKTPRDLWVGHVYRGSPPVRRRENKYYVPPDMYPWVSYPDYTAGAGYVVSGNVAAKIFRATLMLNSSLHIDDVFMGICAKAMGVAPRGHLYFSGTAKTLRHYCIYSRMITSHGHTAVDMHSLWQATTDPKIKQWSGGLYCSMMRLLLLCRPYFQNTYPCAAALA